MKASKKRSCQFEEARGVVLRFFPVQKNYYKHCNIMQFSKDQWNSLLSKNTGGKLGEIVTLWQSVVIGTWSFIISLLAAFDLSSAHFSRFLKTVALKSFLFEDTYKFYMKMRTHAYWTLACLLYLSFIDLLQVPRSYKIFFHRLKSVVNRSLKE